MNLDFNVLVFLIGFIFALPIIGYLFRFNIPISIFFLLAGTFMIAILLATDNIELGFSETASINSIREDDIDQYSQLTRTGSFTLRNGSNIFVGERANVVSSLLYNKDIDEICLALGKTGTPTGTAIIGIYNTLATPSATNVIYQFGTIDVSTLPTTGLATYCFEHTATTQDYTLFLNVAFGIFYNGGSVGNNVNLDSSASNPFDGTNTIAIRYQSSWTTETASDIYGLARLNIIVEDTENTIEPNNLMDFSFTGENYQLKVIMIFISIMFMVGGALVEVKQR